MSDNNISVLLKKKMDISLEERPITDPKEGEVQVSVDSVGICGSDVHYWTHGAIGNFVVNAPMVLGHESAGIVTKLGSGVQHLAVGDRVALEPGVPCATCEMCKSGRYNLCSEMRFLATPPIHGDLCRYFNHAADFCFKLPDHVTLEEGALLEPLSVAVHACRRAGVTLNSQVLICGAGPIGLVNLLVARAMGASKILITDIDQHRLDVARSLGADLTLLVTRDQSAPLLAEKVGQLMQGQWPDKSIECSGAELSIQLAMLATRSGGVVVLVGLGPTEVNLPISDATCREVDIRGIFRYANCYPIALSLIAEKRVDVKPLITHRFDILDAKKAFEMVRTGSDGVIKAVIKCAK